MLLLSRDTIAHIGELQGIITTVSDTRLYCERLVHKVSAHLDYYREQDLSCMCAAASEILKARLPETTAPSIVSCQNHAVCGFRLPSQKKPNRRKLFIADITISQFRIRGLEEIQVYVGTLEEYQMQICGRITDLEDTKRNEWKNLKGIPSAWPESQLPPSQWKKITRQTKNQAALAQW